MASKSAQNKNIGCSVKENDKYPIKCEYVCGFSPSLDGKQDRMLDATKLLADRLERLRKNTEEGKSLIAKTNS